MIEEKPIVLIVDDEASSVLMLDRILCDEYRTMHAMSGKEAIDRISRIKPDIILLDALMPEMNGYEVFATLKQMQQYADIPVVFVTALNDEAHEEQAMLMDAVDYISKPFSAKIVKARVHSHIKIKKQEDALRQLNEFYETSLIQKSKMASMGEMISVIAHQWKQPLNALNLTIQDIKHSYDYNELTKEYLYSQIENCKRQIDFMSSTINDFRDYFKPNKDKKLFDVVKAIEEVIYIYADALKNSKTTIKVKCNNKCVFDCQRKAEYSANCKSQIFSCIGEEMFINGISNEFKQAILNIISNAKDACNNLDNGVVEISLFKKHSKIIIEITDNGGGIPKEHLDKIFEPYFTTKQDAKGDGLGLYMAKMIIQKDMNGTIAASNTDIGACFRIELGNKE